MPYPEDLVAPMRMELTQSGIQELRTAAEVEQFFIEENGVAMLVINSVCGCAAGQARPGVRLALQHPVKPERVATVFAGQDIEATAKARCRFPEIPPSSPSIALFKQGELVHFVPRQMIIGCDAEGLAADLTGAFERHCAAG